MKKNAPIKATRDYSIRIVIYGLRSDKEAAGDLLSDVGCFLQHPYAAEVIPGVQYDNPHYLIRPDAEMPKLENLSLDALDDDPTHTEIRDEVNKGYFLQIIESAGADGGAVTGVNTSSSPRLRTQLMGHQIMALAMMHEKESGHIEEPMFPSLWRKEVVKNSKKVYYRHTVTGSLEPRPIPAMGGILADDMGLGKTLSVLALICSSLDLNPTVIDQDQKARHQGTLIIAPKSTIYSWMDQASEHIHEGQIRIKVYHGSGRESLASQFCNTDVVVTTYETLRSEWEASEGIRPLFSWKWLRVILDEGEQILVYI
ncbi:putative SWI/SNF-related matrix-associated actin-dependent regulator of chromatin subfamily A member 3-like 1 [Daldinia childiae]|nr:putative SWI/SNF-related matrix-associated actin-dependent regulator of chromatin subfamily A member 3-like 1 [Daldinia childiae]KAF3059266.1 putative SWI/SNF-related matrix-associated actin-dependent regulator of chromatin subfamily A member 3-like 1 [Daldinia childiae]